MRIAVVLCSISLLLVPLPTAEAGEPKLDRIDYSRPKEQLVLGAQVAAGQRTRGIVKQLAAKGKTPEGTLSQIVRWVGRNLRTDAAKAGSFRGVDQILQDGKASGEADRAMVIGVMARIAGIPATWVKTISGRWLELNRVKAQLRARAGGRTFLEMYLDGRWQLLDPVSGRLYTNHDVKERELPGQNLAYDKGGDPYALILSNRLAAWKAQLEAYLARTLRRQGRWAQSKDLLAGWRVYVTGERGAATYARDAAKSLGWLVARVSRTDWTNSLKRARGRILIVTTKDGVPNLPKELWRHYLGTEIAGLYEAGRRPGKAWISRTFADGTRVILVTVTKYGPVELAVSEALEG